MCRQGGRLALTAWEMDAWWDINREAGRPITYESHSPEWAEEQHLHELLAEAFELELQTGTWRIEAGSAAELWELVSTSMPPLRAWLASIDDEARSRAERVYLDYLSPGVFARDYVLVLGTRR